MLEIKHMKIEMKNCFDRLIIRLDISKKRITKGRAQDGNVGRS